MPRAYRLKMQDDPERSAHRRQGNSLQDCCARSEPGGGCRGKRRFACLPSVTSASCIQHHADLMQSGNAFLRDVRKRSLTAEESVLVGPRHPFKGELLGEGDMQGPVDANDVGDTGEFVPAE